MIARSSQAAIEPSGTAEHQRAEPLSGDGEERHREPVAEEERDEDHDLLLDGGAECEERGGGVAERDALEDAGESPVGEIEMRRARVEDEPAGERHVEQVVRETGHEQTDQQNEPAAAEDLLDERAVGVAARAA